MELICALHTIYAKDSERSKPAVTLIDGWALCNEHARVVLFRNLRYPDGRIVVLPTED